MLVGRLSVQFSTPFVPFARWLFFLAAAALIPQPQSAFGRKLVDPPPRTSVASTWVGFTEDELYLFRLTLSLEGESLVGFIYVDNEPRVFNVSSWSYDKGSIEIKVVFPPGTEDWNGPLVGSVNHREMNLRMSGKGWSRSISLRREAELEERWLALKSEMAKPLQGEK